MVPIESGNIIIIDCDLTANFPYGYVLYY